MTMIDDIRRDREAGTPGPWRAEENNGPENQYAKATIGVGSIPVFEDHLAETDDEGEAEDEHWVAGIWGKCDGEHEANARRIARVPQMEAALLAAEELAKAADLLSLAAQTTGGTAGPDECLIESIDRYSQKRAAFRAAMEAEE